MSKFCQCSSPQHCVWCQLVLLLMLLTCRCLGMAAGEHNFHATAVLGVDPGSTRVTSCLAVFNDAQDDYTTFYQSQIKANPKLSGFSLGNYGHRLFFHWPFNSNPHQHAPLKSQVELTLEKDAHNLFWSIVISEQARRNRQMMKAVEELGYFSREWKNAIASIIYDVHLLCDISSASNLSVQRAVADTGSIQIELEKAFQSLFNQDAKTANSLANGLRKARLSRVTETERAKSMLSFLTTFMPVSFRDGQSGVHYKTMLKVGVIAGDGNERTGTNRRTH